MVEINLIINEKVIKKTLIIKKSRKLKNKIIKNKNFLNY